MKVIKWVLIVIVVLALVVFGWLAYMGVFAAPKVSVQKIGPFTLVYEEFTGPYSSVGPVLQKVDNALKAEGIVTQKGFGIYLNDPKMTKPNELRSEVGCILEDKDLGQAKKLRRKFKVKTWKKTDCLVAEFPVRNNLSYMIGPMKAYPELNKAMNARGAKLAAAMEIYDVPAGKTLFIFQLAK